MQGNIPLLRAVGAIFLRQLIKRLAIIPLGILLLVFLAVGYLGTQVDSAWWLALIVLVPVALVFGALVAAAWVISGVISPRKLTFTEAKSVRDFTDKVMATAETARTPLPILGAKLAKDIVFHRDPRLLREFIADSTALKSDYLRLKNAVSKDVVS